MKTIGLLLLLLASSAFAAEPSDSLSTSLPDLTFHLDKWENQRLIPSRPRIVPDRIVFGNMKYFIRIVPVNPMIDPRMIKAISPNNTSDNMPVVPLNPRKKLTHPRLSPRQKARSLPEGVAGFASAVVYPELPETSIWKSSLSCPGRCDAVPVHARSARRRTTRVSPAEFSAGSGTTCLSDQASRQFLDR